MKKFVIAIVALGFIGCPEHEPQAFMAQATIKLDASCVAQPQVGSQALTVQHGVLDLASNRYGYVTNVQLVNFMAQSQSVTELTPNKFHLENNIILVSGLTVDYEMRGMDVTLPGGFFVDAPTAVFPGEAAIAVANIIPPAVVRKLREDPWFAGEKKFTDPLLTDCYLAAGAANGFTQVPLGGRQAELLVKMTFEGVLQDGTKVFSNELKLPVTICTGCLFSAQLDSGLFMHALDSGESQNLQCTTTPCVQGQDTCTSYESCFGENFSVDSAVDQVLATCASDDLAGVFPPVSATPYLTHPTASFFIGSYEPSSDFLQRWNHLRFRYAFEKVNTYCFLMDEAPLWPPPN